jgi:hypothetical protein
MNRAVDMDQLREELVDAFEFNEDDRLRALLAKLSANRRQARSMLDDMLESEDVGVRQAAVFVLGELGGTASLKRLEKQMEIEQARTDYDSSAVLEIITQALGRIKEVGARESLIRRLERLVAGKRNTVDLNDVAYALWRKRHPELIPVLRNALERLTPKESQALRALLFLLETPPDALAAWIANASVPLNDKTEVLTILDEGVPDELIPVMPVFIAAAVALGDAVLTRDGDAPNFCDRLFTTLLLNDKRVLPALPAAEARSELRALARRCVTSADPSCSIRAVWMLARVGRPEDAELVEAHRPADEGLAKNYDEYAERIRNLPRG